MPGMTTTQSIRHGVVGDPLDWTMMRNEADDIAVQLDAADVAKAAALGRPVVNARRNATIALADGVTTLIPLDSELYDSHGMVDVAGPNPSRVTVSAASGIGHYMVSAVGSFVTTGWTRGDLLIFKNGTYARSRSLWFQPGGSINASGIIYLGTVGDYVDVRMLHSGGGSTNATFLQLYVYKLCDA